MVRYSRSTRSILGLVAALQLAAPGAAAWADALLDAQGRDAPVHIESHSTPACAHVHPADCGLCHFLGAPVTVASVRRLSAAPASRRALSRLRLAAAPCAPWRYALRPRAPPALS